MVWFKKSTGLGILTLTADCVQQCNNYKIKSDIWENYVFSFKDQTPFHSEADLFLRTLVQNGL